MKSFNQLLALTELCLRRSVCRSRPFWYVLEASEVCNLACPLCPQALYKRDLKGRMTEKTFNHVWAQISPYAKVVAFHNWGDPFTNPLIFRMIECVSETGCKTVCSSNLTYLNKDQLDLICHSSLDELWVSIDGFSQSTYEVYRRNGSFQKAFDHLSYVARNNWGTKIVWQFLVNRYNEHELEAAAKAARKLKVGFVPAPMRPLTHAEPFMNDAAKLANLVPWLPKCHPQYSYEHTLQSGRRRHCYSLWTSLVVNCDGTVYPCCSLHDHSFGNLCTHSLEEIWNGATYISNRLALGLRHRQELSICAVCRANNYPLK